MLSSTPFNNENKILAKHQDKTNLKFSITLNNIYNNTIVIIKILFFGVLH